MFPGPLLNSERYLLSRKTTLPQQSSSKTKANIFFVGSAVAAILCLTGGLIKNHIKAENAKHSSIQAAPRDHTSEAFSL